MNYKAKPTNLPPKKNLNWQKLGFDYKKCDYRFQARWKNGQWDDGQICTDEFINLHEGSTAIHYAQQCFEGLKAKTAKDGRILLFRPSLNWERMKTTAKRLMMPAPSKELFFKGLHETVLRNYDLLPPFGHGASLYLRPLLIGVGSNLGIRKAPEYIFRIFASPVGPYYKKGQVIPITLKISDNDRVAPSGIGAYKAGANYIAGLQEQYQIKKNNADDVLFLDPLHHKYLEEAGAANIIVYFKNNTIATPKASTILPSITRKSAMTIASDMLNIKTEVRQIDFYQELPNILELANCGTAAVVSPIGRIIDVDGKHYDFHHQDQSKDSIMIKLGEILNNIQLGIIEDSYDWNYQIYP
ncbi:MAG: branched-chain amino acid aminotransferase [SAR324 cluster bacterium]|nr:branched-chain amino acid aminotransferase [SAR324 cluster bacterium]